MISKEVFKMQSPFKVFLLSFVAGLGTGLGGLLAIL
jgi:hypothetical protein